MKNDFSLEKINIITEEWAKIDNKNSSKELTGLISLVTQQLKLTGLTKNEIEANILKIKSKLIDDSEKRSEKIRLRKKIEDLTKQISQLENNLNFIKTGSDNKVLDGVYNDIEKLKNQLNKNEKKYILIK